MLASISPGPPRLPSRQCQHNHGGWCCKVVLAPFYPHTCQCCHLCSSIWLVTKIGHPIPKYILLERTFSAPPNFKSSHVMVWVGPSSQQFSDLILLDVPWRTSLCIWWIWSEIQILYFAHTSGSFGHCVEKMLRVNPGWNKINPISKYPQWWVYCSASRINPPFLLLRSCWPPSSCMSWWRTPVMSWSMRSLGQWRLQSRSWAQRAAFPFWNHLISSKRGDNYIYI